MAHREHAYWSTSGPLQAAGVRAGLPPLPVSDGLAVVTAGLFHGDHEGSGDKDRSYSQAELSVEGNI